METRIARVCWNTNCWVKPSGRKGKARSDSHEESYGFGHEEWLLDMNKMIGNYHYAFLEPVFKFIEGYVGKSFKMLLYTIDASTRDRYWLGYLDEVEVIGKNEARSVLKNYRKEGWLQQMKADLIRVGLKGGSLVNPPMKETDLFNVKIHPESLRGLFQEPLRVPSGHRLISSNRYVLLRVANSDKLPSEEEVASKYSFESGDDRRRLLATTAVRTYQGSSVELELKHNELSMAFLKFLQGTYGRESVRREVTAYGNSKVDAVAHTSKGDIFYEIKTYNHLKTSIREAVGQLLEYCYYPNAKNAEELWVVSDLEPGPQIRDYVKTLKGVLQIRFGYIQFDPKQNKIVNTI